MRNVEVEKQLVKWAEAAWKKTNGDWQVAGEVFVKLVDKELDTLDPALAVAIEEEVWKNFANQQINKIVQRDRSEAREPAPVVVPPTKTPPTGANSHRTQDAANSNQATRERLYLDKFYLTTSKMKLRDATFDQMVKERVMRGKKCKTAGKDERMLIALEDKLRHEGFSEGDPRPIGEGLQDSYVEKLKLKHYEL
jgi:hypothetical protein